MRSADKLIAYRQNNGADLTFHRFARVVDPDPAHDGVHLNLCLRYGNARLQTGHHRQVVSTAIGQILLIESNRHPQPRLLLKKLETHRHHADHRVLLAVQQDLAVEDIAIAAVATLPEAVAEHDDF